RWESDPQYSHGYLVPACAAWFLLRSRDRAREIDWHTNWWGAGLVALGAALHLIGNMLFIPWLADVVILPVLLGFSVLVGGWPALRWAGPAIGFLFFMLPLPYRVESLLASPLQLPAARTSTFGLPTLGFPALAEGTDIFLGEHKLQVAAACSGLGMLLV